MRAAIYARVSTGEQNPDLQLDALREFAARRGFTIVEEYVDYVSGRFDRRRRRDDPGYQKLISDAAKHRFDVVLVWKYDRLARSLEHLIAALDAFNRMQIDFVSVTQNIDTTTPMGRFFFHVIGSFAELERELIVERVRAGLRTAVAHGKRLGRPRLDETRVIELHTAGRSIRAIARETGRSVAGVSLVLKRLKEKEQNGRNKSGPTQ